MRFLLASAVVLLMLTGVIPTPAPAVAMVGGPTIVAAAQQQPAAPKAEVDINLHRSGGGWWANPVWIAIGAVALVVLILLVAMIFRGGGTTIIKE
jgi:hypothetical protein